jgi:hypothetical protein
MHGQQQQNITGTLATYGEQPQNDTDTPATYDQQPQNEHGILATYTDFTPSPLFGLRKSCYYGKYPTQHSTYSCYILYIRSNVLKVNDSSGHTACTVRSNPQMPKLYPQHLAPIPLAHLGLLPVPCTSLGNFSLVSVAAHYHCSCSLHPWTSFRVSKAISLPVEAFDRQVRS